MKNLKICALLSLLLLTSFFLFSCQKAEDVQVEDTHAEISQEETTASVPALNDLHEVIYQMWHSAFPEKDYALIKELLPQLASLTEKLDQAELPGILRDKKEQWDEGKGTIKTTLDNLHKAVDADNKEDMLSQVEAFHSSYERLVRTISPVVPELEAFHQELYKLYHYHMPNFELELIRSDVAAMQEKVVPLRTAQLSTRLASRQEDFQAVVDNLETELNKLAESVKTSKKQEIADAVERVHTAYQNTEKIFD